MPKANATAPGRFAAAATMRGARWSTMAGAIRDARRTVVRADRAHRAAASPGRDPDSPRPTAGRPDQYPP